MSLTFILKMYLRFKRRKKHISIRFQKNNKLNKKMNKSKFMDYGKRKDKDVMDFRDGEQPL